MDENLMATVVEIFDYLDKSPVGKLSRTDWAGYARDLGLNSRNIPEFFEEARVGSTAWFSVDREKLANYIAQDLGLSEEDLNWMLTLLTLRLVEG